MRNNREVEQANNLFEQPWWLDIVAENSWQEAIVVSNGEIVGRLPYCLNNKSITLPTLTQTCGVWLKDFKELPGNERLSEQKKIIGQLLKQLPDVKTIKIALAPEVNYFLPFLWEGFKVTPRVTYRIDALGDIDRVYSDFSKTVKKNIKSAQKKVEISKEADVKVLLELMDITFRNQGRKYPISKDIIEKIINKSEYYKRGKMYTARDTMGNVHACSYFVYDENVFYYLIAGSDPEYRSSGAQTLILWEAIKDASDNSRIFDFEGSMIEGIETFFRRFGGSQTVYYEICRQSFLNEIFDVAKPKLKKMLGYKI